MKHLYPPSVNLLPEHSFVHWCSLIYRARVVCVHPEYYLLFRCLWTLDKKKIYNTVSFSLFFFFFLCFSRCRRVISLTFVSSYSLWYLAFLYLYYPVSLSLELPLSFLLSWSLSVSLFASHSSTTDFKESFSFSYFRSLVPRPYLVTHKRPACNSSSVYISQRTACFCDVRVTSASWRHTCSRTLRSRTHTRIYYPACVCVSIVRERVSAENTSRILSSFRSS